jgi:hypothetical protein
MKQTSFNVLPSQDTLFTDRKNPVQGGGWKKGKRLLRHAKG